MTAREGNPARTSALLARVFPPGVVAYELRTHADPRALMPEEVMSCEAFRPNRLAEFAAGRLCARRALDELSFANVAVRRNPDRSPAWPEQVVGSITHTIGFCGAVAGLRADFGSLGVDAELVARVGEELWSYAFVPGEILRLASADEARRDRLAAVAFSAKEAFYKCQFAVTGLWLDYRDVTVDVIPEDDDGGTFVVRPATANARWLLGRVAAPGRYAIDGALAVTGISVSDSEAQSLRARTSVESA